MEIKNCPFCGGEAELKHGNFLLSQISYVQCKDCFARTSNKLVGADWCADEEAIKAWNKRVTSEKAKQREQRGDDEIKVGDVVERNGIKGIVYGIYDDGSLYGNYLAVMPLVSSNDAMLLATINGLLWEFETVQKTGKHYPQIAEIFAELRGENDDS